MTKYKKHKYSGIVRPQQLAILPLHVIEPTMRTRPHRRSRNLAQVDSFVVGGYLCKPMLSVINEFRQILLIFYSAQSELFVLVGLHLIIGSQLAIPIELFVALTQLLLFVQQPTLQLFVPAGQLGGFLEDIFNASADLAHLYLDVGDVLTFLLEFGDDASIVVHLLGMLIVELVD